MLGAYVDWSKSASEDGLISYWDKLWFSVLGTTPSREDQTFVSKAKCTSGTIRLKRALICTGSHTKCTARGIDRSYWPKATPQECIRVTIRFRHMPNLQSTLQWATWPCHCPRRSEYWLCGLNVVLDSLKLISGFPGRQALCSVLKSHLTSEGTIGQKTEQSLRRTDGSHAFPNYISIHILSTKWTIKHYRCLLELRQRPAYRAGLGLNGGDG